MDLGATKYNGKFHCLISDENSLQNMWKLGRVVKVFYGKDGLVRQINLFTGASCGHTQCIERSVHKMVVLLE